MKRSTSTTKAHIDLTTHNGLKRALELVDLL